MPQMTAGQAVLECLKAEGVKDVFGLVGHTFLAVLDAFHGRSDMRFIGTRHEQAAALMADGYARVTGRPGVCLVVAGPGGTNLVTGVAGAFLGYSPVIALVGGNALYQRYRDALQEFDLVNIFKPVTKLSLLVNKPERIPELLRHAFRTAMTGRRGPVYVELPQDVNTAPDVKLDIRPPDSYRVVYPPVPDGEAISRCAQLLKQATRPLIIAGGGVVMSGASAQLVRLAERMDIPMVTGYARNDAVPNEHPLYVGPLGRSSSPEATELCRKSDLLLIVGSHMGYFATFYDDRFIRPGTAIVQIDIDARDIGRNYPVALGIQGDAKAALDALLALLDRQKSAGTHGPWQEEARVLRQKRLTRLDAEGSLNAMPLKPQRVYHELRRVLPANSVVVMDGGAVVTYGYDRLKFSQPRTFLAPLDLGCIGWAFSVALGAKVGRPHAPVVAIHGDGGFLMGARELETAVRERIPVVTIVMNNNSWGSEKAYQKFYYNARYVGADITNPRFDKLAQLFGAKGYYVERPGEIGEAVAEAIKQDVPSVIEIPVDPAELPVPAHAPRDAQWGKR